MTFRRSARRATGARSSRCTACRRRRTIPTRGESRSACIALRWSRGPGRHPEDLQGARCTSAYCWRTTAPSPGRWRCSTATTSRSGATRSSTSSPSCRRSRRTLPSTANSTPRPPTPSCGRPTRRSSTTACTEFAESRQVARGELLVGDSVREITQYARRIDADLIVVGHKHLEGWAARWWRGAMSPALIEHAHCSVLVVITH